MTVVTVAVVTVVIVTSVSKNNLTPQQRRDVLRAAFCDFLRCFPMCCPGFLEAKYVEKWCLIFGKQDLQFILVNKQFVIWWKWRVGQSSKLYEKRDRFGDEFEKRWVLRNPWNLLYTTLGAGGGGAWLVQKWRRYKLGGCKWLVLGCLPIKKCSFNSKFFQKGGGVQCNSQVLIPFCASTGFIWEFWVDIGVRGAGGGWQNQKFWGTILPNKGTKNAYQKCLESF